jgi:hypothetical protein
MGNGPGGGGERKASKVYGPRAMQCFMDDAGLRRREKAEPLQ